MPVILWARRVRDFLLEHDRKKSLSLSACLRVELTAFMAGFGSFLAEDVKINKQLRYRLHAYGFLL